MKIIKEINEKIKSSMSLGVAAENINIVNTVNTVNSENSDKSDNTTVKTAKTSKTENIFHNNTNLSNINIGSNLSDAVQKYSINNSIAHTFVKNSVLNLKNKNNTNSKKKILSNSAMLDQDQTTKSFIGISEININNINNSINMQNINNNLNNANKNVNILPQSLILDYSIMTIKENSNIIYSFNFYDNIKKQIEVNFNSTTVRKFLFNWNSRICQVKNILYITGGHDDNNNGLRNCYTYVQDNPLNVINEIKSTNYPHWGHTLIHVEPKFIFLISGSNSKKCEYYDLQKKNWINISEINIWRMDCTAFIYNNTYLYVFGGWNNQYKSKDPFIDKIERIKLFSPINENLVMTTNKWEIVKFTSISNSINYIKKTCMGMIKLNENRLLLIGGDTSDYLRESLSSSDYSPFKIKYHTSPVEIKINFTGECLIELNKFVSLEKPCCFTINKNFIQLPSKEEINCTKFACFNHTNEISFCEYKESFSAFNKSNKNQY